MISARGLVLLVRYHERVDPDEGARKRPIVLSFVAIGTTYVLIYQLRNLECSFIRLVPA